MTNSVSLPSLALSQSTSQLPHSLFPSLPGSKSFNHRKASLGNLNAKKSDHVRDCHQSSQFPPNPYNLPPTTHTSNKKPTHAAASLSNRQYVNRESEKSLKRDRFENFPILRKISSSKDTLRAISSSPLLSKTPTTNRKQTLAKLAGLGDSEKPHTRPDHNSFIPSTPAIIPQTPSFHEAKYSDSYTSRIISSTSTPLIQHHSSHNLSNDIAQRPHRSFKQASASNSARDFLTKIYTGVTNASIGAASPNRSSTTFLPRRGISNDGLDPDLKSSLSQSSLNSSLRLTHSSASLQTQCSRTRLQFPWRFADHTPPTTNSNPNTSSSLSSQGLSPLREHQDDVPYQSTCSNQFHMNISNKPPLPNSNEKSTPTLEVSQFTLPNSLASPTLSKVATDDLKHSVQSNSKQTKSDSENSATQVHTSKTPCHDIPERRQSQRSLRHVKCDHDHDNPHPLNLPTTTSHYSIRIPNKLILASSTEYTENHFPSSTLPSSFSSIPRFLDASDNTTKTTDQEAITNSKTSKSIKFSQLNGNNSISEGLSPHISTSNPEHIAVPLEPVKLSRYQPKNYLTNGIAARRALRRLQKLENMNNAADPTDNVQQQEVRSSSLKFRNDDPQLPGINEVSKSRMSPENTTFHDNIKSDSPNSRSVAACPTPVASKINSNALRLDQARHERKRSLFYRTVAVLAPSSNAIDSNNVDVNNQFQESTRLTSVDKFAARFKQSKSVSNISAKDGSMADMRLGDTASSNSFINNSHKRIATMSNLEEVHFAHEKDWHTDKTSSKSPIRREASEDRATDFMRLNMRGSINGCQEYGFRKFSSCCNLNTSSRIQSCTGIVTGPPVTTNSSESTLFEVDNDDRDTPVRPVDCETPLKNVATTASPIPTTRKREDQNSAFGVKSRSSDTFLGQKRFSGNVKSFKESPPLEKIVKNSTTCVNAADKKELKISEQNRMKPGQEDDGKRGSSQLHESKQPTHRKPHESSEVDGCLNQVDNKWTHGNRPIDKHEKQNQEALKGKNMGWPHDILKGTVHTGKDVKNYWVQNELWEGYNDLVDEILSICAFTGPYAMINDKETIDKCPKYVPEYEETRKLYYQYYRINLMSETRLGQENDGVKRVVQTEIPSCKSSGDGTQTIRNTEGKNCKAGSALGKESEVKVQDDLYMNGRESPVTGMMEINFKMREGKRRRHRSKKSAQFNEGYDYSEEHK